MSKYPFSLERSNLLGTEAFRNLLGESLKKAKQEVVIFSAYIKLIGVEWLEKQLENKKIKCTLVARWEKSDLAQGSSDLDCYTLCKKNKWQFKILKDLHAKIMLVDSKDLFIGSPNLTGRGMSLVPVSNKEMGIKVAATDTDIKIINNLLEEAILVNEDIYSKLKEWKKNLPEIKKTVYPDFPETLKTKLRENLDKIWVHNFPWSKAEDLLNFRENNVNIEHDLILFGLKTQERKKDIIKSNFKISKIYKWFLNKIKKQTNREIFFGELSSIIHNSLLDDPTPYRQDVKKLQINFLSYLKLFLQDEIKIDTPYKKSERIILKK
ncbi:phospholipase D family protein [Pelagibacteraceae bacterium]|nr:phospholipase D family protein [Pelagibacteraceae bacterium]